MNSTWKDENVDAVLKAALDVKRLVNQNAGDINTWTLAVNVACSDDKLNFLKVDYRIYVKGNS